MTKVINFFGGPNSGKSTLCASIFAEMKFSGILVDCAWEYARELFYERKLHTTPQKMIFYEQKKRIERILGKVEFALTDAPLLVSLVYGKIALDLVLGEIDKLDNINILLQRNPSVSFQGENRLHNEAQAKEIDKKIASVLTTYRQPYVILPSYTKNDIPCVMSAIIQLAKKGITQPPLIKPTSSKYLQME